MQLNLDTRDTNENPRILITESYLEEPGTDPHLKLPDPGGGKQRPDELPMYLSNESHQSMETESRGGSV